MTVKALGAKKEDVKGSNDNQSQKYSRLRCLLRVKGLAICFYLG